MRRKGKKRNTGVAMQEMRTRVDQMKIENARLQADNARQMKTIRDLTTKLTALHDRVNELTMRLPKKPLPGEEYDS